MRAARPEDRVSSPDGPPDIPWHDTPAAMAVAGVGGVVAIAALVFAIMMTSHQAGSPVQPERFTTPVMTTKPSARTTTTTTSGTPQTPVSTSDDIGTSSAPPPPSSQDIPVETSALPTTTMSNPYATTTAPAAGAV